MLEWCRPPMGGWQMQRRASQCSKVMRWPHFTLCAAFKHKEVTLQCERNKARLDSGARSQCVQRFQSWEAKPWRRICQLSVGGWCVLRGDGGVFSFPSTDVEQKLRKPTLMCLGVVHWTFHGICKLLHRD